MEIGTLVEIVEDEYPNLIGLQGKILKFSEDGTVATVDLITPILCSVSNLKEV